MTTNLQSTNYYNLPPEDIAKDIHAAFNEAKPNKISVCDFDFFIHPHVYPSHKFRSTYVMLDAILEHTKNKKVCEIGCGAGTLGQIALLSGAQKLVQGDINPFAVENAKVNKALHALNDGQLKIYESNCFDAIPLELFDILIFAMPYHNDNITIVDPLLRAFYDPNFESIKKFLSQAINYSHKDTQIFIAFSNKGDTEALEYIFQKSDFYWELYKKANSDARYDNRVYRLLKQ